MRQKSLLILLTAALLSAGLSACGTKNNSDSDTGLEISPISDDGDSAGAETENQQDASQAGDTAENTADDSDTDVISDISDSGQQGDEDNPVSVTFEKSIDEIKSDDGTVICTNSVQMPVVSIKGAEDIAEKINADLEEYYKTFSTGNNGTVEMAREDYAASLGEDGWDFLGYSTDISVKVTRMDDAVISFQITLYDFTGGAHGNYGSGGRNYSAKTGELLSFDEIAGDYEAFHATVLDYMINLAESPAYKDKLFGPPSKDDLDSALFDGDNWVFTRSGISFLAAPYVLGPYASGEIAFMLPYEKAYELGLKEDYRYNGNFVDERYYIYKSDPETFEPIVDGTPDCYFDLDGDGTEEGLAFYGQVVDPETGESSYAFYIDGKDYGDVINDELENINDNGYMENTYALYHADAPDGGVPAIAVLFTEFGEGTDSDGNPVSQPLSFIFGYTKEMGLYYMYWDEGFVTLPRQP
ncbi:DUF3298/DUF4163 domain-containing protein [bacterium 1xD42-87]|nr:DUF3298/DUF4163 domain-containing protein [bacterium 1xD42-87]